MIVVLAGVTAALAVLGAIQALAATWLVRRFARQPSDQMRDWPGVSVLKPLHGDEPLLEAALATLFHQDYPTCQFVFGVQSEADPAIAVVRRLQARFPHADTALVVDPTRHGPNRKVGNLINMLPAAKHDVVVIADSDVHARADYLQRLVAALQQPGVGLVTTLYAGLPATRPKRRQSAAHVTKQHATQQEDATRPNPNCSSALAAASNVPVTDRRPPIAARLGATYITHSFLPSAVLSRAMGRQDCLGATMALRRRHLSEIGGLHALVEHLADDNVLGRRITGLGLRTALADTVVLTTVPEARLNALFRHELRWARTIRALEPVGFAASALQYPLAWGLMSLVLSGAALWSVGLFLILWLLRSIAALGIDTALAPWWREERGGNDTAALAFSCPVWLLPLRDTLSMAVMLASYGGRRVEWRGQGLHADTPLPTFRPQTTFRPLQETETR